MSRLAAAVADVIPQAARKTLLDRPRPGAEAPSAMRLQQGQASGRCTADAAAGAGRRRHPPRLRQALKDLLRGSTGCAAFEQNRIRRKS